MKMIKVSITLIITMVVLFSLLGYFGFTAFGDGVAAFLQELPFGGSMFRLMDSIFKTDLSSDFSFGGVLWEDILKILFISLIFNGVMIFVKRFVKMTEGRGVGAAGGLIYKINEYAWRYIALIGVTLAVSGGLDVLFDAMMKGLGAAGACIAGFVAGLGAVGISVLSFQTAAGVSLAFGLGVVLVNKIIRGIINTLIIMLSSVAIYYAYATGTGMQIFGIIVICIGAMLVVDMVFSLIFRQK